MITTKHFKVTLLSDIILNQSAATEGPNETLDFIPGNCFLGIVAGKLYKDKSAESIELFHSKKVFFGDAHPAVGNTRTLRVPASLYYPKLSSASKECYVHHLIPEDVMKSADMRRKLLKQCRNGFYNMMDSKAVMAITDKNMAIKSAHDKTKRTSKEGQLFSYESLQKGLELYFEVCIDKSLEDKVSDICNALVGEKHIGRSRSAQYGLVKIEEKEYDEVSSKVAVNGETVIYADSRLIFIDKETGLPTFKPSVQDLGFNEGRIVWEKSQVRTFCYSPWNFKRQCFDSDRCGFEKGSVIVVEGTPQNCVSQYIGSFNNEGFGKIIYNPAFLEGNANSGVAKITLHKGESDRLADSAPTTCDSPLFQFLMSQKAEETSESSIIDDVNNWIEANNNNNLRRFKGDRFPSQWGTIRSLASIQKSSVSIWDRLFNEKYDGYLVHGVAKDKWRDMKRIDALQEFLKPYRGDEAQMRKALVNLAAEMAKRLKRKEE